MGTHSCFLLPRKFWDRVYITSSFTYTWKETVKAINFYRETLFSLSRKIYIGGILARQALREIDTSLYTYAAHTFSISIFDSDVDVAIGDGKKAWVIPFQMDDYVLTDAIAGVYTKGVSNTTHIQVRRRRLNVSVDMLSTKITIGDEYFARDGVIDPLYDDVQTGDQIYIDVDAIHITPPKGLSVTLAFQKE